MPFALAFIALLLIVTGFKGTFSSFASNIVQDAKGFIVWVAAIMVLGAIGYIPGLKKISDAFLALVLLAMFLSNKGFFVQFNQAIRNPVQSPQGTITLGMPQVAPLQPLSTVGSLPGG